MPITGRKLFKDSLLSLRGDLPAGTLGVNFHQTLWAEETMEPVLTKMVRESAQLNSDPVTYTKSWSSKPCLLGKRFNLQFKVVLHKCFLAEKPQISCSYSSFCHHCQLHIVRPILDSRGTCKCELCENCLMIQQSLKSNKLIALADNIFISLRAFHQGDDEQFKALLQNLEDCKKGENKEAAATYKRCSSSSYGKCMWQKSMRKHQNSAWEENAIC